VADKQFANLGVVLVGVLADAMSVVGPPTPSKEEDTSTSAERDGEDVSMKMKMNGKPTSLTVTATSLRITGLQSGELVERMYDSDDTGEVVERTKKEDEAQTLADQAPRPRPTSTRPRPKSIHGTATDAHQSDLTELTAANDEKGVDTDGNQAAEQGSRSRQTEAPALSASDATTPHAESSLRSDLTSEPRKSTSRSRDRPTSDTSKTSKSKEKKRKKGKRNAIDDLFAGLS
jgi:hypothetical protein